MFINPQTAIDNGWITGTFTDKNIQPNAIDFTLDKLFSIDHENCFIISEDEKHMRGGEEIEADYDVEDFRHWWPIDIRTSYDAMSSMYVKLPEGVAAMLIVRSTFNRNGLFITSGLYDSGYEGHIGFALHNLSGPTRIATGTRIGQIMFIPSDSAKMYDGGWNHGEDTNHSYTEPEK
jgi:deoxycytidine triphosphate deaminase